MPLIIESGFDIHHKLKVWYTEIRVYAGLGYIILSSFEDFLHENSLENRAVLEEGQVLP